MLKKYFRRDKADAVKVEYFSEESLPEFDICKVNVIEDDVDISSEIITLGIDNNKRVNINNSLSAEQKEDIHALVESFSNTFSEIPGLTSVLEHHIKITLDKPFRKTSFPVPLQLQDAFNSEVDKLLQLGVIEPSTSPYSSSPVLVRKPDKTYRVVLDFRPLNSITEFDAEPMPTSENELYKFRDCQFISEIDITKAYYQVPLHKDSRKYTAFPTDKGLMQFTRMPFGLVTACATYVRLMRNILDDLPFVVCYFDNIFVASKTWEEHIQHLTLVLERLRKSNLTAKPQKCNLGFKEIDYLGFRVGNNKIIAKHDRISDFLNMTPPSSKKGLRSFLGSVNFYRRFIPNMADKTVSLTNYLKKGIKEPFQLSPEALDEFSSLKQCFVNPPILEIPDLSKDFCLRTDASAVGLGAVLLQYHEDIPKPVAFASYKLLDRETRYSTVERECLGIVWGIERFKHYLYGRNFILEVDHRPLIYLENFKGSNSKLLRWSLALQLFQFTCVYISGEKNHFSDILSRSG